MPLNGNVMFTREAFQADSERIPPRWQFNSVDARELGAIEPGIRRAASSRRILRRS